MHIHQFPVDFLFLFLSIYLPLYLLFVLSLRIIGVVCRVCLWRQVFSTTIPTLALFRPNRSRVKLNLFIVQCFTPSDSVTLRHHFMPHDLCKFNHSARNINCVCVTYCIPRMRKGAKFANTSEKLQALFAHGNRIRFAKRQKVTQRERNVERAMWGKRLPRTNNKISIKLFFYCHEWNV